MKGISQTGASFSNALKLCGTMDREGNTIGIVNVEWAGLRWIPLGLRLFGLILVISMGIFKYPLGFLPGDRLGIGWMSTLEHWELFTTTTWVIAIVLYATYFVASILRNGLYFGIPGLEIQFSRYGEIVRTLKPGELAVIFDPRVAPSSVISTKPMVLELDTAEGFTKENITVRHRGRLVIRVANSLLLSQQGGFDKFFKQIQGTYASSQQDRLQQSSAKEFNLYMIEPARYPAAPHKDGTLDDPASIEREALSPDMLMRLSDISEIDISTIGLGEQDSNSRHSILPTLAVNAERSGIELLDYIPQGNLIDSEYFQTLAFDLVQWVQRLRQAANILKDILQQEIDEEITARVANKQRGLLRMEQLSSELVSATEALKASTNLNAIINATESTMKNHVDGMLAEFLSKIEALIAKMDAETVDAAGVEMFLTEYEKQLATLDELVKNGLPAIDTVFLDKLSQDGIVPDIDVLEQLLTGSGIRKMLEKLKEGRKDGTGSNNFDAISKEAAALDANQLIQSIQQQLAETTAETGIDTAAYTPEAIARKIDAIAVEIASAETSTEITTSAVTAA